MSADPHQTIETPSGKGAGDENFPVGSWLLPKALRPHVAAFYRFARAIDDIADNPTLAADDKIARLERFGAALRGESQDPALETAHRLRASLQTSGVTPQHGLDLITAFKRDAVKGRYDNWNELMDYCRFSASPVGRFLIDLHGGDKAAYPASDALCSALQVLNHLQDCAEDYHLLNRVYLPGDWLAAEGLGVEVLTQAKSPPGLHAVIGRCLEKTQALLIQARPLTREITHPRLAREAAIISLLAWRLLARLKQGDPLAGRVALSKLDFLAAGLKGLITNPARAA